MADPRQLVDALILAAGRGERLGLGPKALLLPDDAGSVELLLSAQAAVEIVPVEPWNIKLTTPEDWTLAQALESIFPVGLHAAAGEGLATDVGRLDSDRRRRHHGPAG